MKRKSNLKRRVISNWQLYLFLLPVVLYFLIFRYVPMAGVQIAFRDYNPIGGIWGSPFVGLKHFIRFFHSADCWMVIGNTLKISLINLIAGFPIPIILALLLNMVRNQKFKKVVQTTIYAPHFISAVVIVGMINLFLSPTSGIINKFIAMFGG
ncbi:MAG: sugar ABC transporter permease, partial [Lachnospiraceae bacterium]